MEDIKDKLINMANLDQEARLKYPEKILEIDKKNRTEFKRIFRKAGFISKKYGKKAQEAAFFIVQHMPRKEVQFMKRYLSLMKNSMEGYSPNMYAMLTDRVRNWEGKEQLYGTQFMPIQGSKYRLMKIYKEEGVNRRRLKIGLEPLEEYIKKLEEENRITIVT